MDVEPSSSLIEVIDRMTVSTSTSTPSSARSTGSDGPDPRPSRGLAPPTCGRYLRYAECAVVTLPGGVGWGDRPGICDPKDIATRTASLTRTY
jgi:hypothetical protein